MSKKVPTETELSEETELVCQPGFSTTLWSSLPLTTGHLPHQSSAEDTQSHQGTVHIHNSISSHCYHQTDATGV